MKKVFLIKQLGRKEITLSSGRVVLAEHILVLRIHVSRRSRKATFLEIVEQPFGMPRKKCEKEKVLAQGSLPDVVDFLPVKFLANTRQFCSYQDGEEGFAVCTPVVIRSMGLPYYLGVLEHRM